MVPFGCLGTPFRVLFGGKLGHPDKRLLQGPENSLFGVLSGVILGVCFVTFWSDFEVSCRMQFGGALGGSLDIPQVFLWYYFVILYVFFKLSLGFPFAFPGILWLFHSVP